jgi:hypothetical protein
LVQDQASLKKGSVVEKVVGNQGSHRVDQNRNPAQDQAGKPKPVLGRCFGKEQSRTGCTAPDGKPILCHSARVGVDTPDGLVKRARDMEAELFIVTRKHVIVFQNQPTATDRRQGKRP